MTYLHLVHICAVVMLYAIAASFLSTIMLCILLCGCQLNRDRENEDRDKGLYVEKF